jgi:hypothetical protein
MYIHLTPRDVSAVGSENALNELVMMRRRMFRELLDKGSRGACAVKMSVQAFRYGADQSSAPVACIRAF